MNIGDAVRIKGRKGRPEKFVVTNALPDEEGLIEVTSVRDKLPLHIEPDRLAEYKEPKFNPQTDVDYPEVKPLNEDY